MRQGAPRTDGATGVSGEPVTLSAMTPPTATDRTGSPMPSRRNLVLRRLLIAWAIGYPLVALSISAVGGWAPGRWAWLAGMALLAWAVARTRPPAGLADWLRRLRRRR